eukprot:TRINITY_DN1978_c0_g1_i1.p1 TRINITY_DN1978_c0_g1~~TRINITY_DN1978_c0_g1_i1.p1  ORF type:complete len:469 (-),score=126.20 TRINITY_DN1978_c0_g1_i1:71-1441(-)
MKNYNNENVDNFYTPLFTNNDGFKNYETQIYAAALCLKELNSTSQSLFDLHKSLGQNGMLNNCRIVAEQCCTDLIKMKIKQTGENMMLNQKIIQLKLNKDLIPSEMNDIFKQFLNYAEIVKKLGNAGSHFNNNPPNTMDKVIALSSVCQLCYSLLVLYEHHKNNPNKLSNKQPKQNEGKYTEKLKALEIKNNKNKPNSVISTNNDNNNNNNNHNKNKKEVSSQNNDQKQNSPSKLNDQKKNSPAKLNDQKQNSPSKLNDQKQNSPAKLNDQKQNSPAKLNDQKQNSPAKLNDQKQNSPAKLKNPPVSDTSNNTSTTQKYQWQMKKGRKKWVFYTTHVSKELEAQYLHKKVSFQKNFDGVEHIINFENMTDTSNNVVFTIKRTPINKAKHVWQYFSNSSEWWNYDPESAREIETNYKKKVCHFELEIKNKIYVIDLSKMTQRYKQDTSERNIRRFLL